MSDAIITALIGSAAPVVAMLSMFAVMRSQVTDLRRAQVTAPTGKDLTTLTAAIADLSLQVKDVSHRRLEKAERELGELEGWRKMFASMIADKIEALEQRSKQ